MLYEDAAPIIAPSTGYLPSDPRLMSLVNQAQAKLRNLGIWVGMIDEAIVCTPQICFSLPWELEAAVEVAQCDDLTDINNGWYRMANNPALYVDPDQWSDDVLVDRGEHPTVYDICTPSHMRVTTEIPEDAGKTVWFSGISSNAIVYTNPGSGYVEGETVAIPTTMGGSADTASSFNTVNKIKKSKTAGYIRIYAVSVADSTALLLAILAPQQTEAKFRRYQYPDLVFPGVNESTRLRITGIKRFIPISCNTDEMLIPNAEAVALMCQSIQKSVRDLPDDAKKYELAAVEVLTGQVKNYMLDPSNIMLRRAQWLEDEKSYDEGTLGYVRARCALQIPGAIHFGKSKLNRMIQDAQEQFMIEGKWVGTTQREYNIPVNSDGTIDLPDGYVSILAASIEGVPVDVESEYYEYNPGGWGLNGNPKLTANDCNSNVRSGSYSWRLVDQGTVEGTRQYLLRWKCPDQTCPTVMHAVLRRKFSRVTDPEAQLQVPLFPANKTMLESFLAIDAKDYDGAAVLKNKAMSMLDKELEQRRGGIITRPRKTYGMTTAVPSLQRGR